MEDVHGNDKAAKLAGQGCDQHKEILAMVREASDRRASHHHPDTKDAVTDMAAVHRRVTCKGSYTRLQMRNANRTNQTSKTTITTHSRITSAPKFVVLKLSPLVR